jgi:hypothetical protein
VTPAVLASILIALVGAGHVRARRIR